MGQIQVALVIARHDLRRRVRNRSALLMAFVGPLALAVVFSVLVGGAAGGTFELGLVDLDGSHITTSLVDSLVGDTSNEAVQLRFVRSADEATARREVDDGDLGAAIVLPAGFADAAISAKATGMIVIRDPERPVAGQVAESVAATIASGYERVSLSVALFATLGGASPTEETVSAARDRPPAVAFVDLPVGGRELSTGAFYGAAMAILFLFFTVGFAARSVLTERQAGTLGRTLATPASPGAVIAGKTLSVGLLGLAGFLTVWLVTSVVFDAPWGDSVAVVVLIVATVFAIAGVATFVASLARSERQADAATSVTAFVLALLGGNFVGPNMPPLLRRLSVLTPNGWSLRAFTDLNTDAAGMFDITTTLVVLAAMGLVFGTVGVLRVRRVMLR
jgi:ABC-2 type transport system permease protein